MGRALVVAFGALGAFVAFDAILLFIAVLVRMLLNGAPNPYIGLLLFVALPLVAAIGATVAWLAYLALRPDHAAEEQPGRVRV